MVLHHRWLIIFGTSSSMANHADGGFSYLAQHLWHIIINGASWALMGASSLMSTSLMTLYHQWCFIINGSSSMALYHQWLIICSTSSLLGHHHWWSFLFDVYIIDDTSSSMVFHLWHFIINGSSSSMGLPHQWGFLFFIGGLASIALHHQCCIIIDGASFLFDVYIIDEISWSTMLNH